MSLPAAEWPRIQLRGEAPWAALPYWAARARELVENPENNVLSLEVLFDGAHRANGGATEVECVKCACTVAWAAAVVPQDQTPR